MIHKSLKMIFTLVFDKKIYPYIKSQLQSNTTIFHLKRFSLPWVENFSERRHRFSHFLE